MVESGQQPNLITLEDQESAIVLELFPAVWQASERLLSVDVRERHSGLDDLLMTEAVRVSPLIAYLVVTRLFDPDRELRSRIVEALANVMQRDASGRYASDAVRAQIIAGLSQMGSQGLFSLVEVGMDNQTVLGKIARLINFAPDAGSFLKNLAADRSQTIKVRTLAIYLIGRIGYVDAYSELLRIRNRIEASQFGQKSMPFAPPSGEREELLLPELKKVIITLGE